MPLTAEALDERVGWQAAADRLLASTDLPLQEADLAVVGRGSPRGPVAAVEPGEWYQSRMSAVGTSIDLKQPSKSTPKGREPGCHRLLKEKERAPGQAATKGFLTWEERRVADRAQNGKGAASGKRQGR
jgi:hypothetical protein